jgi:uncharacterized protein YcsI (UPF0317 family)
MFKKILFAFLLVVLLSQFAVPTVFAASEPQGSCPPVFTLEMAMVHDNHHHRHVGTDTDKNGDGYICMKPVTPSGKIHVHFDNNLP